MRRKKFGRRQKGLRKVKTLKDEANLRKDLLQREREREVRCGEGSKRASQKVSYKGKLELLVEIKKYKIDWEKIKKNKKRKIKTLT